MSLDTSDNASPWATPTLVSSASRDDENKVDDNRTLAFQIYKEVWNEFNKWKVEDCKQQLLLLQKPLPPPEAAEAAMNMASTFRTGESGDVEVIYLCDTEDDVPLDAGGTTVLTCESTVLELPPDFAPHPRYESCTPSMQTISLRMDSMAYEEVIIAPFVPYADDPTFDTKGYLNQFNSYAWEHLVDPDVEMIQFEVLRRLHIGHGLSVDDIEATNVLPELRHANNSGLMYQMTQRDHLFWTGMMANFSTNLDGSERREIDFRAYEPKIDDLRRRIDSIVPYFCPNPGCIQAFCPRHEKKLPQVPHTVPRIASDDYPEGSSCGTTCFRETDSTFQHSIEWGEPEVDELRCILEIIPDTVPCGLAKLVRRPCREVFMQRRRLIPDDKIYPESSQIVTKVKNYRDENEFGNLDYNLPGPCSHSGPCDINNPECICAQESVHCNRNCHCHTTCKRRWKGCRCAPDRTKRSCATDSCKCHKLGWECDPMVCQCDNEAFLKRKKSRSKKRRVIRPDGEHLCQNSNIQRGLPALEIKRGAFGLGAFAVHKIRNAEFIGEYIGELISNTDDQREILRTHVGLNYSFKLDGLHNIDSARVGNETRYINHAEEKDANAVARRKLVFGETRLGFYALRGIKAGEEVLFNYGDAYWRDKQAHGFVQGEVEAEEDG
ncbi:hypothetical protein BJV74DRAFT_183098 [Russula compacta]|nr:hypothetical protein BJV74DRAFT_183098 [Russula compacta]